MNERIGFVGIGNMGKPMARNLLRAGFQLTVFDINKNAIKDLAEEGARTAVSSKEVGANSDVVFTMLPLAPYSPVLEREILGSGGVVEGIKAPGIIIDGGNTSPAATKRIAKRLEEKGLKMLDAAVSGGVKGATEGNLAIMVGGDRAVFTECLEILQVLGKKIAYVGATAMGQTVKLINNVIVFATYALVSEAVSLGVKAGADPAAMIDVISSGAAGSWVLQNAFPSILQRNFDTGPGLAPFASQLRYALDLGDELDVPLFFTSVTHEIYRLADRMGVGKDKDEAGIINLWEKLFGIEVKKRSFKD